MTKSIKSPFNEKGKLLFTFIKNTLPWQQMKNLNITAHPDTNYIVLSFDLSIMFEDFQILEE